MVSPSTGETRGWCSSSGSGLLSGWSDVTANGGTEVLNVDLAAALAQTDEVQLTTRAWWYGGRYAGGVEVIVSDGATTLKQSFNVTPQASSCIGSPQMLGTVVWSPAEGLSYQ